MSSTATTSLAFFASAAASFHPAPYTPTATTSATRPPARITNRAHDSLAIPPAGMDPQPTDPNVLFIHPPFYTFPNSHVHPDGLTYALMADNPEWFLDAKDFVSQHSTNPHAIPYPPHLEPPRGWCPAKKKDLKERGGDGWPEGEEPRLRCTFCRRTYAGVNAKSMWRRHVFEKHKIAMSNRRDGNTDRPRGRGSGKENKLHISGRTREEAHDSLITMVVAPQTAPENVSHRSRFRPGKSAEVPKKRDRERKQGDKHESLPLTPHRSRKELIQSSEDDSENEAPLRMNSPPLTPHAEVSSDPPNVLSENSDKLFEPCPAIPHPVIPESPYNPLQTPSFRHSPPRLPSDQPWRFPSPSHPLHSNTRDLSLTMLSRPVASPIVKGIASLGTSPMAMLVMHSSPLPTDIHYDSATFETPARSNFLFARPRDRSRFLDQSSSPLSAEKSDRSSNCSRQQLQSSPLPKKSRGTVRSHRKHPSDISEAWLSENCLASSSSISLDSSNNDPFSIYDSWPAIGEGSAISPVRLPKASLEAESPVLRSGYLSSVVGLGIGLLEPFRYPKEESLNAAVDADLKEILSSPGVAGEVRVEGKRTAPLDPVCGSPAELSPPSKKRRMSGDITDS